MSKTIKSRVQKKSGKKRKNKAAIIKQADSLCDGMLKSLQKARSPVLQAVKCSLDNSSYDTKTGYLVSKGENGDL